MLPSSTAPSSPYDLITKQLRYFNPAPVTLASSYLALYTTHPSPSYRLPPTAHCSLHTHPAHCSVLTVHQLQFPRRCRVTSIASSPTPSCAARQKPDRSPRDRHHLQTASTSSLSPYFASKKSPDPIANTRSYIPRFIVIALRRVPRAEFSRISNCCVSKQTAACAQRFAFASRLSRIPLESCRLAIPTAGYNQVRIKDWKSRDRHV